MTMQLGLSSYTYSWAVGVPASVPARPLSAFRLIDKARSSGLKLVQIADNLPLEGMSHDQLSELYIYAVNNGVSLEMGSR